MNFNKREKTILFIFLIILNLILRVPWTPHEIGWDSFGVHVEANTLNEFGHAKWWVHPASIIGVYPYSAPSALPFYLSAISQVAGIDVETAILVYGIMLGLFSIFGAYILAGVIWNNDLFKFFVAFIFSTSQGIVTFSTWTANSRTLFVVLVPLFTYALLKTRQKKIRFGLLTLIMFILLTATHHYIYFLIPVIASYFGIIIFKSIKKNRGMEISEKIISTLLLTAFLIAFIVPFFTRTFIDADPVDMGSRYSWMFFLFKSYTRYIGPPIIFVISGYVYLLFKKDKKFEELFLLLSVAALAPLLYMQTYMKWFIITFTSLFIGIGLTNLATVDLGKKIKRYRPHFILAVLVLSNLFIGYYQFLHFLNDPSPQARHMEERTYTAGQWIKSSIDKNMISEQFIKLRILSISDTPLLSGLGASDISYGFTDPGELQVKQIYKPTEVGFYTLDPYKPVSLTTDWAAYNILYKNRARRLIHQYNISYYVENSDVPTELDSLVRSSDDRIYDNGKIRIWDVST